MGDNSEWERDDNVIMRWEGRVIALVSAKKNTS
jgi:hypothetical protein